MPCHADYFSYYRFKLELCNNGKQNEEKKTVNSCDKGIYELVKEKMGSLTGNSNIHIGIGKMKRDGTMVDRIVVNPFGILGGDDDDMASIAVVFKAEDQ